MSACVIPLLSHHLMFKFSREIEEQVEKEYNHEIKCRRVKKELSLLEEVHDTQLTLHTLTFTPLGIIIPITYSHAQNTHHF